MCLKLSATAGFSITWSGHLTTHSSLRGRSEYVYVASANIGALRGKRICAESGLSIIAPVPSTFSPETLPAQVSQIAFSFVLHSYPVFRPGNGNCISSSRVTSMFSARTTNENNNWVWGRIHCSMFKKEWERNGCSCYGVLGKAIFRIPFSAAVRCVSCGNCTCRSRDTDWTRGHSRIN